MATSDECLDRLSFANYYFALFDGILPGLENHLVEDVVFVWFGKTVKGRDAVVDFIRSDEANTLHTFHDIFPTTESTEEVYNRVDTTESAVHENIEFLKTVPKTEVSDVALFNNDRTVIYLNKLIEWRAQQEKNTEVSEIEKSEERQEKTVREKELERIMMDAIEKPTAGKIEEIDEKVEKKLDTESFCSSLTLSAMEDGGRKYVEAHGHVQFTRRTPQQGALTCPVPNTSKLWCFLQMSYFHRVDDGPVNELFASCELPNEQVHNYQICSIVYDHHDCALMNVG